MCYLLLAAASSVTPTVTTISPPTASPTPLPVFVSIVENTADAPGFWDIAGILSSVILGIVALVISINAYSFAKKQQQREEEMRKREAKIAVLDKAFQVYNFLKNDLTKFAMDNLCDSEKADDYHKKSHEISYIAKMIFRDDIYREVLEIFRLVA